MEEQRALEAFAFDQLRTTCFAIAMPSSEMNCGGDLQIHSTGILKLPENTRDYSRIVGKPYLRITSRLPVIRKESAGPVAVCARQTL
jgi:hypothetical protein